MSETTVAVRERPILFSAEMVRAILDGRKTQTRRVVTDSTSQGNYRASELLLDDPRVFADPGPSPAGNPGWYLHAPVNAPLVEERRGWNPGDCDPAVIDRLYPRVFAGDHLWVRETHLQMKTEIGAVLGPSFDEVMYADHDEYDICYPTKRDKIKLGWRVVPGIHMTRQDSRLTLEVTGVRVERVQEITGSDVLAEGLGPVFPADPTVCYSELWNSLNAKRGYSWAVNPWVWVIEFRSAPNAL